MTVDRGRRRRAAAAAAETEVPGAAEYEIPSRDASSWITFLALALVVVGLGLWLMLRSGADVEPTLTRSPPPVDEHRAGADVEPVPSSPRDASLPAAPAADGAADTVFLRGINLGGPAVIIRGERWMAQNEAAAAGLRLDESAAASQGRSIAGRELDADTRIMLVSGLTSTSGIIEVEQSLTPARYAVSLWVSGSSDASTLSVLVDGVRRPAGRAARRGENWMRVGPYVIDAGSKLRLGVSGGDDLRLAGIEFATVAGSKASLPTAPRVELNTAIIRRIPAGAPSYLSARLLGEQPAAPVTIEFLVDGHVVGSTSTRAETPIAVAVSGTSTFLLGIDLNGTGVTIDGNRWRSEQDALGRGFSVVTPTPGRDAKALTVEPACDSDTESMLNTSIYCWTGDLSFSQGLPNGDYAVYLWLMENANDDHRAFDVRIEGAIAERGAGSLAQAAWKRCGPYTTTVADGLLEVALVPVRKEPMLAGIEIHQLQRSVTTVAAEAGPERPDHALWPYGVPWTPTATGNVEITARAIENGKTSSPSAGLRIEVVAK
ncbi:MAG: hypothetical protein H0W72_05435 [Planctomycetes bacterium]|nr:hypothetical protein [Planctomycetota bacterium]